MTTDAFNVKSASFDGQDMGDPSNFRNGLRGVVKDRSAGVQAHIADQRLTQIKGFV